MELLTPKLGLFVWALVIFLILFFLLRKMAWKPILAAIHSREETIENSLMEAKKAREEMAKLQSQNEALLKEARIERDAILKEARGMKEKIINQAKEDASEEAKRLVDNARQEIRAEKMQALTEIKNQVGKLSIEVAEKLLRQELNADNKQKDVIDGLVSDLNLN